MADLKLSVEIDAENPTIGDIYLSRGAAALTSDTTVESTVQKLGIRLRFFRGEYFADTRQGIPYLVPEDERASILGNKINEATLRAIFRDVFLTTPGVRQLDEFLVSFDATTRTARVDYVAVHESGRTFSSSDFGPFLVGITT